MQKVISKLKYYLNRGSERSTVIKKNILQSAGFKVVSIVLSLLIVPLTINYVSPEQYGIWLTVSSIVAWISYFDLGLGHGLRNKFAESKAKGHVDTMTKYVSTAYALFFIIFASIFVFFLFGNQFIDWNDFLKISQVDNAFLQRLMLIVVGFFCLMMFFKIINSLLLGDQRTGLASGVSVADQLFSLIAIIVIAKVTEPSLIYLSFANFGIPCVVLLLISLYLFSKKGFFSICRPSLKKIDFTLTKDLLGLGIKFFIIQFSLLFIFQFVNIIISRNCGQLAVTQYNISYKYFNMLHMASVIIMTPYWSAFTDAYAKGDMVWMKSQYKKLTKFTLYALLASVAMLAIAPIFFKIWLGDSVEIPFSLHIAMGLYISSMVVAGIQMYILNGIGKVTVQVIIYIFFALVSIPSMDFLSKSYGLFGILLFLSVVYMVQAIVCRIQIKLLLDNKATGLWIK